MAKLNWSWGGMSSTSDCEEFAIRIRWEGSAYGVYVPAADLDEEWVRFSGTPLLRDKPVACKYVEDNVDEILLAIPRQHLSRRAALRVDLITTTADLGKVIEETRQRIVDGAAYEGFGYPPGMTPEAACDRNGRPLLGDMLAARANALAALAGMVS